MHLFEITFYSIDEGCMCPETSWIVQALDIDEVFIRCEELNKKFKNGIFAPRAIQYMNLNDLTDDKIKEEFELL